MTHKYSDIEGKGKTVIEMDEIEWYQDILEDLNEYSVSGLVVDADGEHIKTLYFTDWGDPTDENATYYQVI